MPFNTPYVDDEDQAPPRKRRPAQTAAPEGQAYLPPAPLFDRGPSILSSQGRGIQTNIDNSRALVLRASSAPPSGDPQVNLMRRQLIQRNTGNAEALTDAMQGPNYSVNRMFATHANDRMNDQSDAGVGYTNALTSNVNALTPGQAAVLAANARGMNATAANTEAMTPVNVGMGRAQIEHRYAQTGQVAAQTGQIAAQTAGQRQATQQSAQMFPTVQEEANQRVAGMRTANQAQAQYAAPLLQAQIGMMNRQGVLPETPVDPVDQATKRFKLAKDIADQNSHWYQFGVGYGGRLEGANKQVNTLAAQPSKKLTPDQAQEILSSVGGDKVKARALAQKLGYELGS